MPNTQSPLRLMSRRPAPSWWRALCFGLAGALFLTACPVPPVWAQVFDTLRQRATKQSTSLSGIEAALQGPASLTGSALGPEPSAGAAGTNQAPPAGRDADAGLPQRRQTPSAPGPSAVPDWPDQAPSKSSRKFEEKFEEGLHQRVAHLRGSVEKQLPSDQPVPVAHGQAFLDALEDLAAWADAPRAVGEIARLRSSGIPEAWVPGDWGTFAGRVFFLLNEGALFERGWLVESSNDEDWTPVAVRVEAFELAQYRDRPVLIAVLDDPEEHILPMNQFGAFLASPETGSLYIFLNTAQTNDAAFARHQATNRLAAEYFRQTEPTLSALFGRVAAIESTQFAAMGRQHVLHEEWWHLVDYLRLEEAMAGRLSSADGLEQIPAEELFEIIAGAIKEFPLLDVLHAQRISEAEKAKRELTGEELYALAMEAHMYVEELRRAPSPEYQQVGLAQLAYAVLVGPELDPMARPAALAALRTVALVVTEQQVVSDLWAMEPDQLWQRLQALAAPEPSTADAAGTDADGLKALPPGDAGRHRGPRRNGRDGPPRGGKAAPAGRPCSARSRPNTRNGRVADAHPA